MQQSLFLVECYTSAATAERAAQMLTRLSELPGPDAVVPVSCIAVPSDEMCLCLIEGESAEAVHRALTQIAVGHERIVEAVSVSLASLARGWRRDRPGDGAVHGGDRGRDDSAVRGACG